MSAREIQISIDNATTQLNAWSAELMRLNKELSSAKVGKRASLRKAIKNAEQAIADYNRSIKKLNDDLASVLKTEVRQQDNLELAKQGISPGAQIVSSLGSVASQIVPVITGGMDSTKKSADVLTETAGTTGTKVNYLIYVAIAIVAFLMLKKK
jgi:hypothetical protein